MKRKLMFSIVLAALCLNPACTIVLKETRYTGGYTGHLLDKRTFDASGSKQLQLLRAALILAMAADMGRVTVSGQDADGFAKLLKSAADEINYAAADVYPAIQGTETPGHPPICSISGENGQDTDKDCIGFHENFESNMPRIEGRILKVMLAALPTDKVRKFLADAAQGDVLGAAWNVLGTLAKGAGGMHYAFGRYRSGLEVVAGSLGSNCSKLSAGGKFDSAKDTVIDAAACLGLSKDDLFNNPDELRGDRLKNAEIKRGAFFMLFRAVAVDCVGLPYAGTGGDLNDTQNARAASCNAIGFAPMARPFRIGSDHVAIAPTDRESAPNPQIGSGAQIPQ